MATTELSPQVVRSQPVSMFVADHQYVIVEDAGKRGAFRVTLIYVEYQRFQDDLSAKEPT